MCVREKGETVCACVCVEREMVCVGKTKSEVKVGCIIVYDACKPDTRMVLHYRGAEVSSVIEINTQIHPGVSLPPWACLNTENILGVINGYFYDLSSKISSKTAFSAVFNNKRNRQKRFS